jgi:single-strand DNA-binding protein
MNDINQVVLTGRVTRDPDIRYTPTGKKTARLGLAVNRSWNASKDPSAKDWKEETFFVDVTAWTFVADKIEKAAEKGLRVLVTGRLSIREYTANDGTRKRATEIVASSFEVIGAPQNHQSAGRPGEALGEDDLLGDFDVPEGSLQQGSESDDHDVPFN